MSDERTNTMSLQSLKETLSNLGLVAYPAPYAKYAASVAVCRNGVPLVTGNEREVREWLLAKGLIE